MKILEIPKEHNFSCLGNGSEGNVYKYDDNIALKIFKDENLKKKQEKIELLSKLKDDSFCFPEGIVNYDNKQFVGYYMSLIKTEKTYKDFCRLNFLFDEILLLDLLIKVSDAVERVHKMDVIIGDLKPNNILITDTWEPKFIDTDNYLIDEYIFDLFPIRFDWLKNVYHKEFALKDIDKYLLGIMALSYFNSTLQLHQNDLYFEMFIEFMDVSDDLKDAFRLILSDASNKPYIGPILKRVKEENSSIISKENRLKLNRYYS